MVIKRRPFTRRKSQSGPTVRPWIAVQDMKPALIRRECGGWLAVSEEGSVLRIGFEGATEEEALQAFGVGRDKWVALHTDAQSPRGTPPGTPPSEKGAS